MRFVLTPHVRDILIGRGMTKNGRLLCSATHCLFHPEDNPDPDFGREIEVKGVVKCPRCGAETDYYEAAEWNDKSRKPIIKCKACGRVIPKEKVKWTQWVVSNHRHSRHLYYHDECREASYQ